jgi:hypothetical protein
MPKQNTRRHDKTKNEKHSLLEPPVQSHETFRVRIAVRTLRRNRYALHAPGRQQRRPRLGEHRIPIVDQVEQLAHA